MAKGREYTIDLVWRDDQIEATRQVWVGPDYPEDRDDEFFFHFEDIDDLEDYLVWNSEDQDFKILRFQVAE